MLVGVSAPVYRRREGRELMGMRLVKERGGNTIHIAEEKERNIIQKASTIKQKGRSRKHIHLYTCRGEKERKGRFKRGSQRDGVTS